MSSLLALSVSIGLLGAIATVLYLKFGLLIWAGFIAWACFFQSGGNTAGLRSTIVCNIYGAFLAWVAAIVIVSFPYASSLTLPVWAGIMVGLTVLVLCLSAQVPALSSIPASVYGYAAVFAYLLQTPDAMTRDKLMSPSFVNAFLLVALSMIVGALFGLVSSKMAAALTTEATA
jgi:hypothetical protein